MGPIGVQEMIGILLVALLLFGPKKLPELGRMLGRALHEFRRAKSELRSTFESHMRELEREVNASQSPTRSLPPLPEYSSVHYPSPYEDTDASYNRVPEANSHSQWPPAQPEAPAENVHNGFHAPAVAGTVARSNGTHSVAPDEEERLA